jgi:hypothetical protein
VFSSQIFQENTFLETKPNFTLTEKRFLLINFPNVKQTQKSLKSNLLKSEFRKHSSSPKIISKLKLRIKRRTKNKTSGRKLEKTKKQNKIHHTVPSLSHFKKSTNRFFISLFPHCLSQNQDPSSIDG